MNFLWNYGECSEIFEFYSNFENANSRWTVDEVLRNFQGTYEILGNFWEKYEKFLENMQKHSGEMLIIYWDTTY